MRSLSETRDNKGILPIPNAVKVIGHDIHPVGVLQKAWEIKMLEVPI